jgi:hypothetical protein
MDRIEKLAEERGESRSEAVRSLILLGFKKATR